MPIVPVPNDKGENTTFSGLIIVRESEVLRENFPQYNFVHHKSHSPGIESGLSE
jgi:hypothetical protein